MSLTAGAPTRVSNVFNSFRAVGPITTAGNYVTNGVTLDLTPLLTNGVLSNSLPDFVEIIENPASGQTGSGANWVYALGTTNANGKVIGYSSQGSQLAQTSFAGFGVNGLTYRAQYPKFQ
jgi:hypothetical protein